MTFAAGGFNPAKDSRRHYKFNAAEGWETYIPFRGDWAERNRAIAEEAYRRLKKLEDDDG